MSARPVRAAVVGCGRVAQHYLDILTNRGVEGFDVVAACDVIAERAETFAKPFDAEVNNDLATMLTRDDLDLLVVLTESGKHYEHGMAGLAAGLHVLIEKPLAMLPEHTRALVDTATDRGLICAVALQNRLNPAMAHLKASVGQLGTLVTAAMRLRWARFQDYYEDGWHGTWAMDGGVINQQALHHLDAINWVCGPIEAVCATSTRRLNQLEADDTIVAAVRFAGGALGTLEATTAARPVDLEASLSLVTDLGQAHIGGIALNEIVGWKFPGHDEDAVRTTYSEQVATGYGHSHGPLLDRLVAAIRGEADAPAVTGVDAIAVTDLVHALYASEESGGWVELADRPVSQRLGRTTT